MAKSIYTCIHIICDCTVSKVAVAFVVVLRSLAAFIHSNHGVALCSTQTHTHTNTCTQFERTRTYGANTYLYNMCEIQIRDWVFFMRLLQPFFTHFGRFHGSYIFATSLATMETHAHIACILNWQRSCIWLLVYLCAYQLQRFKNKSNKIPNYSKFAAMCFECKLHSWFSIDYRMCSLRSVRNASSFVLA